MNAQNWYSQSGENSTAPAAMPTLSWIMNASNGTVCSSWQPW